MFRDMPIPYTNNDHIFIYQVIKKTKSFYLPKKTKWPSFGSYIFMVFFFTDVISLLPCELQQKVWETVLWKLSSRIWYPFWANHEERGRRLNPYQWLSGHGNHPLWSLVITTLPNDIPLAVDNNHHPGKKCGPERELDMGSHPSAGNRALSAAGYGRWHSRKYTLLLYLNFDRCSTKQVNSLSFFFFTPEKKKEREVHWGLS